MEIGGILLGTRNGRIVRVVEARPIQIEYGHGASFVLTASDDEALQEMVRNAASRGLDVVGCYESRTRRDISASGPESDMYDRHFPDAGALCLLVKPEKEDDARVAVYIRGEDGTVVSLDRFQDSEAGAPESAAAAVPAPAPLPVVQPVFEPPPAPPVERVFEPIAAPQFQIAAAPKGRPWLFAVPAVGIVAVAAFLFLTRTGSKPADPPSPTRTEASAPAGEPVAPPPPAATPEVTPTAPQVAASKPAPKRKRSKRARRAQPPSTPR